LLTLVNDVNHFSYLVNASGQQGKRTISNCYLLPNDILHYTQQRKMFWSKLLNGIIFYCEENDFFYLYFYLLKEQNQNSTIIMEKLGKPLVIDLVFSNTKVAQSQRYIEEFWLASGFQLYKTYKRYVLHNLSGERKINFHPHIDERYYRFGYPQKTHVAEILKLWRTALDVYSIALPDEIEMLDLMEKKMLLCIFDINLKLVGVIKVQIDGKTGSLWHLAVDEEHRHYGLAKALMLSSINELKDVDRILTWVEENNFPAINLILTIGFELEGKVTRKLLDK